jgi:hypothetical protein
MAAFAKSAGGGSRNAPKKGPRKPLARPARPDTSLPGTSAGQRRIIYSGMLACGKWCGQALMEWSLPAVGTTGKRPIIVSRICGVKQRAKLMTSAGVTDARGGS